MKAKSNNSTVTNIISEYAPTLDTTEKKHETSRAFNENLWSIIKTFKDREAAIISGDFNAKAKSKFSSYPEKETLANRQRVTWTLMDKNDRILYTVHS